VTIQAVLNQRSADCYCDKGEQTMLKSTAYMLLGTAISLNFVGPGAAAAAETPFDGIGSAGKVYHVARCAASNYLRLSGGELSTTSLFLRNFDPVHPITITRLIIYNGPGVAIYDSKILGLPPFTNGILGPLNNTLNPNQSSTILLDAFLPYQEELARPLQLLVESSSAPLALPLDVSAQRLARARDSSGGHLMERSRIDGKCESARRLRPME
jgi:hypothetical protein